jgi:hypothetical protein
LFTPRYDDPEIFTRAATSVEVISGQRRRFTMTFLRFMRNLRIPRKSFFTAVAPRDAGLGVLDGAFTAFQLGF